MISPVFFVSSQREYLEESVIYLLNKLSTVGSVFLISKSIGNLNGIDKKVNYLIDSSINNPWAAWELGLKKLFSLQGQIEKKQLFF